MKSDINDRFYNVGTGERTTIKELAELLLNITGSNAGIVYQPQGLTFVKNRIGSPDRAREEIAFEANVELREGLESLITWRNAHKEEVAERRAKATT